MGRGRAGTLLCVGAAVVVALVALTLTLVDSDDTEVEADGGPRATTAERPTTTTAPPTTTTAAPVTAPPVTEPPPTTQAPAAPATVAAAPPAAVVAPATTPPRPRISLLVVGDSLGFTAAYPEPTAAERPGYVSRIELAALIGCGVLYAQGYTPVDTADEGAGALGYCDEQSARELKGLAKHPTWMVVFSGGWEHLGWIPPGGAAPFAPMSPEMRTALRDELVRRATVALSFGTRTAFVPWVCPEGVAAARSGDYTRWYNDILREAAGAVPGAFVVEPTDRVCVGGDATAPPTIEKSLAYHGESHPQDKRWLWQEWLGPSIYGRS
ncbi:hypothetical protein [Dermatobacter hominis]|uniref:hypothetical protein n=1 Tax=Dermatobacter hominis TaxID=2884263 RepID=UPI001D113BB8|nr:hypothetical protein [Dermatobacter hominis]UDY35644.1 hypothetical protein LH044_20230 [Dermatobacter hominis]